MKNIILLSLFFVVTLLSAREEVITNTTVTQDTTVTIIEPAEPEVPEAPESDEEEESTDDPVEIPVLPTPPAATVVNTQSTGIVFSNNIQKYENDADKEMVFTVNFSSPLPEDVEMVYFIVGLSDGFTLGSDIENSESRNYITASKGDTSAKIKIRVIDDTLYEENEEYKVVLKAPSEYVTYSDGTKEYNYVYRTSYGTILDNDQDMLIDVSVADMVSFEEKDANSKEMEFLLTFSKPLKESVSLKYEIIPNDITLGQDIENSSAINYIDLHQGDTSAKIKIKVLDDNLYEQTEYFQIKYYPPNSNFNFLKTYTNGEIKDDEMSITISDYVIFSEDEASKTKMKFNIAFSKEIPDDLVLNYTITAGDNLVLGQDIKNTSPTGSIVVPKGSKNTTIEVEVLDDDEIEDAEYFTLTLQQPAGSYGFINNKSIGVILDDDIKIDVPTTGGDYIIYETGTTDAKLKTKIVNSSAKFDVYATEGFEIFLGQTEEEEKTCDDPVCSIVTLPDGQKVEQCVVTCYITTTTVLKYSDDMDIDEIVLRTFKNYDTANKQCYGEYPKQTVASNVSLKSGAKYTFSIPTDKAFRCGWIEVSGHSKEDVNETVTSFNGISDTFALRPDSFLVDIEGKSLTNPLIAGKNVEMKVMAVDASSNIVNSYSGNNFIETLSDKYYGDSLSNGLDISDMSFVSGLIKKTTSYDEAGELTLTISEKSPAFAEIDKNDNPSSYKITPAVYTLKVVPDHFEINYTTEDANPINAITFFANDPLAMGSKLSYSVTAKNALNNTTTRYIAGKYADDVDLTVKQNVFTDSVQTVSLTFVDSKSLTPVTKSFTTSSDVDISLSLLSSDFVSGGRATGFIKENFSRDYKNEKNPMRLSTLQIDAQEKNGVGGIKVSGSAAINSDAHFYYARAHVPSPQTSTASFLDAKVYYEVYCKNCDKSVFTNASGQSSVDSIYWYILSSSVVSNFGSVCDYTIPASPNHAVDPSINVVHQTPTLMKITPPSVPHANKVFFIPTNSFLQYSKFGSLPIKHHFTVKFTTGSSIWAGEGTTGVTVDTDISKKGNQAIDW